MQNSVIVTGAAQGIGAAICQDLLQHGFRVIGIDQQAISAWSIDSAQENFSAICLDITQQQESQNCLQQLLSTHQVTGFVHAVGILRMGKLLEMSEQDWEDSYRVNLRAPIFWLQQIAQHFCSKNQGNIVVISSNAARMPRMNMGVYATTKAALSHYCRNLALEIAGHGIRCNIVAPGSTRTAMQQQLWTNDEVPSCVLEGDLTQFRTGIPLGKIAEPEQMAQVVRFLLSEAATQITMQEWVIDGGATLGV